MDSNIWPFDTAARAIMRSEFSNEVVERDVAAILTAFRLHSLRRYFRQVHWHEESVNAHHADLIEPGLKLESVAAHSWHVADTALILAPHFPDLDLSRVLQLAILHDKLEMITGDYDPVGPDGTGRGSHAFDQQARATKEHEERRALAQYLSSLNEAARNIQAPLLEEVIAGTSNEALFIKAVDKLQALAFVILKKDGNVNDTHLSFSVRYSQKAIQYFPPLHDHYSFLLELLLESVAIRRGTDVGQLREIAAAHLPRQEHGS